MYYVRCIREVYCLLCILLFVYRMTSSLACKAVHVSPSGQYTSDPVSVIVSQNDCVSSEQGQVSEFSLLEMTEVEYTHLQHIIQSHIEAQAAEQEAPSDTRTNSAMYTSESRGSNRQPGDAEYTSNTSQPSSSPAGQADTQSSSCDVQFSISGAPQEGPMDIQEIKMVLVSDPNEDVNTGERTPTTCGEVPGSVLAKVKCAIEASKERVETCENRSVPVPLETRPNPPARVRLEKRFNCSPCDVSRQQDSQSAALNT